MCQDVCHLLVSIYLSVFELFVCMSFGLSLEKEKNEMNVLLSHGLQCQVPRRKGDIFLGDGYWLHGTDNELTSEQIWLKAELI